MSEPPINLNKIRKARARAADRAQAAANSVAYGRSKAKKAQEAQETSRMARMLDGKVMETSPYGSTDGTKKS